MKTTVEMRVTRVEYPTPAAISVWLEPEDGPLHYQAGQYLRIAVDIDGVTHWRAYSMANAPASGQLPMLVIKRVSGGLVSNYLCDHLRAGQLLMCELPNGTFTTDRCGAEEPVVLLAAGSGITAPLAIAEQLLYTSTRDVTLVFANTCREQILLLREIEVLKRAFGSRLMVVHLLEQPSPGFDAKVGRIHEDHIRALPADRRHGARWFCCGPQGFLDACQQILSALDVPANHHHVELFTPPKAVKTGERVVDLMLDGQAHSLPVPNGSSILDAANAQRLVIPTSCKTGDCGSCKLRCLKGRIEMTRVEGLTPDEEEQGWILACVGYPRSDNVVLSHA